jgi:hypothetical protein
MSKPAISVTGFWMRNDVAGRIEFLIEHDRKWIVVLARPHPDQSHVTATKESTT